MKAFILEEWLQQHSLPASTGPAWQRLYQLIRQAILEGRVSAGSRLPATRTLAADLGMARNSVLQAYEQLAEEGYVQAGVGSGTYVNDIEPARVDVPGRAVSHFDAQEVSGSRSPQAFSNRGQWLLSRLGFSDVQFGAFMPGVPDARDFPFKAWMRVQNRLWREQPWPLLRYAPAGGHWPLREAVADYLNSVRSVRGSARQVILTTGIHQGIDIVLRMLCDPGDTVWIEEPSYWGVRHIARMAGLRLVAVPVDDEGLWPDAQYRARPPRLIIVSPSHQYPLGVVMSLARRRMLLEYARQAGSWILEDDYDSEFRYGSLPLPSLQGLDDASRVLYAGSFSKTLSPGLRVGYLVVPQALADGLAQSLAELCREGNLMMHAVLDTFLREGFLGQHIRRMRRRYAERRNVLIDAIGRHFDDSLPILGGDTGLHLILSLPDHVDDVAVARDAFHAGIMTRPLSTYYLDRARARSGLLLGYGGVTPEEIQPAFSTLAKVLSRHLQRSAPRGTRYESIRESVFH